MRHVPQSLPATVRPNGTAGKNTVENFDAHLRPWFGTPLGRTSRDLGSEHAEPCPLPVHTRPHAVRVNVAPRTAIGRATLPCFFPGLHILVLRGTSTNTLLITIDAKRS